YAKPAPRSLRKASGRRPGKQPGTPGSHLAMVEHPDVTITHRPERCSGCSEELAWAEVTGHERRQVFELPEVRLFVTEHVVEERRCRCGAVTAGTFPKEATAPACYGPRVRALGVYLLVRQHLPYERAAELFSDVLGARVSVGTLANMAAEASGGLGSFIGAVTAGLIASPVVHFDETGARVASRLAWVHSASTSTLTAYLAHRRRGREAMEQMGVIGAFSGVACHDGWTPYATYIKAVHALCNAHHLRELEYVATELSQPWASEMARLLIEMKAAVERATEREASRLDPRLLGRHLARYDAIVATGLAANPPATRTGKAGRPSRSKAANLAHRLEGHRDEVLRFATDFAVPFDNNQAERDVRMVKLQQKISGCFRSEAGAECFCRVRSYLSTAHKQGERALDVLTMLFAGSAWMPAVPGG
ncbi:MAG: IS66 family transposase, partial [Acidimicrobiales bacterium]